MSETTAVARALRRARGTLTIVAALPGARRAHHRSRTAIEARRDARIARTVAYAARFVPYYRELFRRERIDPRQIGAAADLRRIPQVDRTAVQRAEESFRAQTPAAREALAFRTSGSTAMPLTVHHDRTSLLANIAHSERERAVEASLVGSSRRYTAVDIRSTTGTLPRVQQFYAEASFRPMRPGRHQLSVDDPPGATIDAVNRLRPDVVRSYGAYLELLFRVAATTGSLRHRPSVVVYAGDVMSSAGRELIEEEFGIPVLSAYNAVECFKIAFTCEARAGFHLHEDLCDVRLVDAAGEDVPVGETGEVVVSNLVNRGTVLLNYRLGDRARFETAPCACGRTSRRLVDLDGRVDDAIALDVGEFVYPTRVWRVFRDRPEILRYQLVQRARDRFELRVVAADGRAADAVVTAAVGELRELLRGADVSATRHETLREGPGGKFRHLVPLGPRDPG